MKERRLLVKIYQFTPQLRPISEPATKAATNSGRPSGISDFSKILTDTISTSTSISRQGAGKTVSLENHRALNPPPSLGDLGPVKNILGQVHSSILNSTPEQLNQMHSLEGLIYVYSPSDS